MLKKADREADFFFIVLSLRQVVLSSAGSKPNQCEVPPTWLISLAAKWTALLPEYVKMCQHYFEILSCIIWKAGTLQSGGLPTLPTPAHFRVLWIRRVTPWAPAERAPINDYGDGKFSDSSGILWPWRGCRTRSRCRRRPGAGCRGRCRASCGSRRCCSSRRSCGCRSSCWCWGKCRCGRGCC